MWDATPNIYVVYIGKGMKASISPLSSTIINTAIIKFPIHTTQQIESEISHQSS